MMTGCRIALASIRSSPLFSGDPPNTRAGSNVCVVLNGGLGVVGGVRVCFSSVSAAGEPTLVTRNGGRPPPTGLKIVGTGGQPVYYDFNTTATFSGLVTVCIAYDGTQLTAGQKSNLKLMHFDGSGFTDITSSLDTINDFI